MKQVTPHLFAYTYL